MYLDRLRKIFLVLAVLSFITNYGMESSGGVYSITRDESHPHERLYKRYGPRYLTNMEYLIVRGSFISWMLSVVLAIALTRLIEAKKPR